MTDRWQSIPLHLDPIAMTVGSFSLYWYAVFFLAGWVVAYAFAVLRFRKGGSPVDRNDLDSLFLLVFAGAFLGGRLGYALFYDPSIFLDPARLVSPYGPDGSWTGISGMSFFGGVVGFLLAVIGFSHWRKRRVWEILDFLVPLAPVAIFFGRIGNFLNLELYGRETDIPWGMYFPGADGLRHPSQLYEAFFEGVILLLLLSWLRKKRLASGMSSFAFLLLYGIFRFILECFREPDAGVNLLFDWMTRGQAFSLVSVAIGVIGWFWISRRRDGILEQRKGE